MKRKLAIRLTVMVTVLLIFMAVLVAMIFSGYTSNILVNHHQAVIANGVENVAVTFGKMLPQGCTREDFLETVQHMDDMDYMVELLQGVTYYRVLIGDEAFHYLELTDDGLCQIDASKLPDYTGQVLADAMKGKNSCLEILEENEHVLTGGAAIYNAAGEVAGAVLIQHRSSDAVDMQKQIDQVLFIGGLISLLISLVFLIMMSIGFTRPIKRIEYVADQLACGNLEIQTNITSQDEVGQLAASMDQLAGQLRQARENRENEETLRNRFLADVSHDLKTPVTVIRGSLEALCDGVVSSAEETAAYHRQMLAESCYLQKLIQDLLELTSLKNREFKSKEETVNLSELMGDAAISARTVAAAKNVIFCCEAPKKEYCVTGDYDQLRKLLMLILENAVKYTAPGKRVFFYQEAETGSIVIRDEGRGISKEALEHIFDRYFRADDRRESGSAGLGLSIAKAIAERHRITIQVESREGEGSCFSLVFEKGQLKMM